MEGIPPRAVTIKPRSRPPPRGSKAYVVLLPVCRLSVFSTADGIALVCDSFSIDSNWLTCEPVSGPAYTSKSHSGFHRRDRSIVGGTAGPAFSFRFSSGTATGVRSDEWPWSAVSCWPFSAVSAASLARKHLWAGRDAGELPRNGCKCGTSTASTSAREY